jgi:hypothetical protein
VIDERSVPIFPKKAALTTDTARRFAIDLPKRCTVDWDNQKPVMSLPEEKIEMVRLGRGDPLPPFNVADFSFKKMTVPAALEKLLAKNDIQINAEPGLNVQVSGEISSGNLDDAAELIAKMGRAYFSYDDDTRVLTVGAHAKWLIKMPKDQHVIMALIDAMHGADMRNLTVDWQDKTLVFEGNHQTEKEALQIIADLGARHNLIAWDIDVYRVYPRTDNPIVWMNMLPAFGQDQVKMSVPGVVGRALVVGPEINTKTLQRFMAQQGNVVLISQGTFVIPDGWQSRFDIGQCSREERLETDLIIGAVGKYGDYAGRNKIDAKIALHTRYGELAQFSIPSSVGDNVVIVGIPTHSFVQSPETLISPFAELAIFMSPRLISVIPKNAPVAQPLSGDALREFLKE